MSDAPAIEQPHRKLSPWMLIGGLALLAIVGAVLLAIVAVVLAPQPSPVPEGIARTDLADGSVLVVHGLGDTHRLELPKRDLSKWERLFSAVATETFHGSSQGNSLTLWLARYDAQTGEPLEFDHWSHCIVRTPAGHEVYDLEWGKRDSRQALPHSSSSSISGRRPFAPTSSLAPGTYSHILYSSSVPRFRSATGEVEIDIYESDDEGHAERTATLAVPLPGGPTSYPTWTADPLPVTASEGDLAVTLKSMTLSFRQDSSLGHGQPRRRVRADMDVRQDGEPSAVWSSRSIQLADALGNESHPYDCTLAPGESGWNVKVKLFRSDEAALLQGFQHTGAATTGAEERQRLVIEDIALPDDDPATTPNSTQTGDATILDGVTIELLGVGGPGKAEYHFKTSRSGNSSHSWGNNIETEWRPPNATLTVDDKQRHIALKVTGDSPDRRVVLLLTDQNGLRIDTSHEHRMNEVRVWLFETDEWVERVNAYITVQRARNVEFTVAPPRPVPDE